MTNDYLFGIQSHIQRSSKGHAQKAKMTLRMAENWEVFCEHGKGLHAWMYYKWKKFVPDCMSLKYSLCYLFERGMRTLDKHVCRSSHFSSAEEAFIASGFPQFQGLWTWTDVKCCYKCHWIMFILSSKLNKCQSYKGTGSLISKLSSNFNCKV